MCLAITPDGELLASGGADRSVRLWRLWNPVLREVSHTRLGDLRLHDVDRLKSALRRRTGPEQDWADMIEALVRWRHRHDIAVDAAREFPDVTDIELGGDRRG
jgi:hypothetical protein